MSGKPEVVPEEILETELSASWYDWDCPHCDATQTQWKIPYSRLVICFECGRTSKVAPRPKHVYQPKEEDSG